jgi:protein-S-isoprenylcysteine O-methyltransferase Ste14
VLALTLGQAKTIAVVVAIVLIGLAVVSVWVMKTIAQKAAVAVILGLLALLVWTQRSSLQECADKVRAEAEVTITDVDTTCSFFGRDVTISTARDR